MDEKNEREEHDDQPASGPQVNIGGGVGGDVKVAGGDLVEGDKISVGNVEGDTVAIGSGAQATHIEGLSDALAQAFEEINARLDALEDSEPTDVQDAKSAVREIVEESAKGDDADEGFLEQRFRNLARMGPDIVDVVTATVLNPAAGFARVVQLIAEKAREDKGLDPV